MSGLEGQVGGTACFQDVVRRSWGRRANRIAETTDGIQRVLLRACTHRGRAERIRTVVRSAVTHNLAGDIRSAVMDCSFGVPCTGKLLCCLVCCRPGSGDSDVQTHKPERQTARFAACAVDNRRRVPHEPRTPTRTVFNRRFTPCHGAPRTGREPSIGDTRGRLGGRVRERVAENVHDPPLCRVRNLSFLLLAMMSVSAIAVAFSR